jgi:RES domain-containing protein
LRKTYARAAFDGEGAYRYGGRWSSPGTRLSYTSEHQSLAMLEYFVHLDVDDAPGDLVLAVAEIPDDLARERAEIGNLPANWRESAAPPVLAPNENNWLINPAHSDYNRIVVREVEPLSYDPRMFRKQRSRRRH